jgi:hypothetical protein
MGLAVCFCTKFLMLQLLIWCGTSIDFQIYGYKFTALLIINLGLLDAISWDFYENILK